VLGEKSTNKIRPVHDLKLNTMQFPPAISRVTVKIDVCAGRLNHPVTYTLRHRQFLTTTCPQNTIIWKNIEAHSTSRNMFIQGCKYRATVCGNISLLHQEKKHILDIWNEC
jgi:hypothetical protein